MCCLEEVDVKRVLNNVMPALMSKRSSWRVPDAKIGEVTDDDEKILRYLAGGLLKWGLRRFKKPCEQEFLKSQIVSQSLPEEFKMRNRGGLVCPSDSFHCVVLSAERQFRREVTKMHISEGRIVNNSEVSHFPPQNHAIIQELLARFVRTRAHFHLKWLK